MKLPEQQHLNEDQILWAVIDEGELPEEVRDHLMECQVCNERISNIRDELHGFGENAVLSVPALTKKITLPHDESGQLSKGASWLPSFGVAVMAGLVLFFYFLGMESMNPGRTPLLNTATVFEDEYLMEEIFEIVENPLFGSGFEINGENSGFNDEFLEFIVPDIQEDYQSQYLIQGGLKQC